MTALMGLPTEGLYAELSDLPHLIKIAWHEAQADPDRADEILAEAAAKAKRIAQVAGLHLRGSVERATRRENAMVKATGAAENRIAFALADLVAVQGDELNPHGFHVYCLWGHDTERPLYVGQSTNIYARLGNHMSDRGKRAATRLITVTRCKTERQMDDTEWRLIKRYQPPLNTVGIDK